MSRLAHLRTILGCLILVAAASCGGGTEEASSTPVEATPEGGQTGGRIEGTNQSLAADPGEATEIAFTMDGTGLDGPDSVPAGWVRINFENRGDSDHHLALVRLTGGKTVDDLRSFIQQDPKASLPDWALSWGGPADTSPGVTAVVTQNLQEGSYVWVTYVLGDDEIARPGLDLIRPFEVSASSDPGVEPTADAIIGMLDYDYGVEDTRGRFDRYEGGSGLEPGLRIIKVDNESNLTHEARLALIEGAKQARDFPDMYYMNPRGRPLMFGLEAPLAPFPVIDDDGKGPGGPPPGTSVGGVMAIQPGQVVYITIDLEVGWYFVYDMLEDVEIQAPYLFRSTAREFGVR